jgi:hypothetical protein
MRRTGWVGAQGASQPRPADESQLGKSLEGERDEAVVRAGVSTRINKVPIGIQAGLAEPASESLESRSGSGELVDFPLGITPDLRGLPNHRRQKNHQEYSDGHAYQQLDQSEA